MALDRLHLRKLHRLRAATVRGVARAARDWPTPGSVAMAHRYRLHPHQRSAINRVQAIGRGMRHGRAYSAEAGNSYAKERDAIAADIQAGRDPHTHAAARYHSIRPEDVTSAQRKAAKARNFVHLYSQRAPRR